MKEKVNIIVYVVRFMVVYYNSLFGFWKNIIIKFNILFICIKKKKLSELVSLVKDSDALLHFTQKSQSCNLPYIKKDDKRYGIVIIPSEWRWYTFSLTLAILLDTQGKKVEIIVDDLRSCEECMFFNGITQCSNFVVTYLLQRLHDYYPEIDISYLSREAYCKLTKDETKQIDYIYQYSRVWLEAHGFCDNKEYNRILRNNAQYIKHFFSKDRFYSINVYTGQHLEKGIYTYFANKRGIRLSSYDSNGLPNGVITFAANGPAAWLWDINLIIKNKLLSDDLQQKIIREQRKKYKKVFEQLAAESNKAEYRCDILIPLNISWDAAGFGVDRIFSSYDEWYKETLQFLLENTNAKIVIREHPARRGDTTHIYRDYFKMVRKLPSYDKNRIEFVDYKSNKSTYCYLINSKVVLPYSTTVGLEAVVANVPAIIHTQVYYGDLDIAYWAVSKSDYFERIKFCLNNPASIGEEQRERAMIALYLHSKMYIKTWFNENNRKWMFDKTVKSLLYNRNIRDILEVISDGKPIEYIRAVRECL